MVKIVKGKYISAIGSWFSDALDLRCPACGARSASILFWRCSNCGYPSNKKIRCPGCGRQTARTRDWACQWCGHPLTSPLYQETPVEFSRQSAESESQKQREEQTVTAPAEESRIAQAPVSPATPEPVMPIEKHAPIMNPTPDPEPGQAAVSVAPIAGELPPPVEVENEPAPAIEDEQPVPDEDIAVTVAELRRDFNLDPTIADIKYHRRTVKVKGVVVEVVPGAGGTGPVLVMGPVDNNGQRQVTCAFEKRYAAAVRRLGAGQRVAALGRYDTYGETDIRLVECMLVG